MSINNIQQDFKKYTIKLCLAACTEVSLAQTTEEIRDFENCRLPPSRRSCLCPSFFCYFTMDHHLTGHLALVFVAVYKEEI